MRSAREMTRRAKARRRIWLARQRVGQRYGVWSNASAFAFRAARPRRANIVLAECAASALHATTTALRAGIACCLAECGNAQGAITLPKPPAGLTVTEQYLC
jgi:hypothetical protein